MGLLLSYYRWFKLGPEDCTTAVPQRQWPAHNVWVDDIDHGEAGTLTLMRWPGMRLETRVFPRGNGKPLKPWMNSDIYRKWNLKAGDMCLIPFCFYFSSCWPLWLNSILLPLRVWVFFFLIIQQPEFSAFPKHHKVALRCLIILLSWNRSARLIPWD